MKIIFHDKFYESNYANDGASVPGRMEAIISTLQKQSEYSFVTPDPANEQHILLAHTENYLNKIKTNKLLYEAALLSVGGAIKASEFAMGRAQAFACIRPPGHHAYRDFGWGYCHFCNMGIALLNLRKRGQIKSAFLLDFDAHTGDGTKDVLSDWKEVQILNPMADNRVEYIKKIEEYIKTIDYVDMIAVCAGFDSYELDVGRKLKTFDFYNIGVLMKQLAKRMGHNRRFAVLEGGYYLPDLGKNVLAFCNGFE